MNMMQHADHTDGENKPVELNKFINQFINITFHSMQTPLSGLEIDVQKDFDEAIELVTIHPQQMGLVIQNVLTNAFQAVGDKKGTEEASYVPSVRIRTKRLEDEVEIKIMDNGPGIPVGLQSRIFEPFFTTRPTGTGTGLGLSLSFDIVTQGHGGAMKLESTSGDGATFVIRLPLGAQ